MKIRFVALLVMTIAFCSGQNAIVAQETTPTQTPTYEKYKLIYEGDEAHHVIPASIRWSYDNQKLMFDVETLDAPQHYAYDVPTKTLTSPAVSPLEMTLTDDQQATFRA